MFSERELGRISKLLHEYINYFCLDLSGLTVFTEAATGYYMLTSIMCALAGASKVYAFGRDSRFGSYEEVRSRTIETSRRLGCPGSIVCVPDKTAETVGHSDIVMNSGFVRPITADIVSWMKPTAVVPLMWETWEFRPSELDLQACKEHGILVMGTDEVTLDRFPFAGYLPMKLLFLCDIEIFKNNLLLIGSGRPGRGMATVFHKNGFTFRWISYDDSVPIELAPYHLAPSDTEAIEEWTAIVDAVVCFEHVYNKPIIAQGGLISPDLLNAANESVVLIFISGVIDYERIKELGIFIYPDRHVPFGTMSIGTWELGPRSVIELNMAGIKVGEAMARARLSGLDLPEAAKAALRNSLAQDFPGENAWIND
jgi:hypothetical protein